MTGPAATLLSILMIAAFLLAAGALWTFVKRQDSRKAALMLIAAAVMLLNVLIWAV